MNLSRKSLIGTFALVATLSTPLAFAQTDTSATQQTPPPADTTSQPPTSNESSATTSNDAAASTSNDAAAAATAGDPSSKKSWADVDLDKDGKLTKAEASAVPALGQVFDKADANADGSLTTDEYKEYVAKSKEAKGAKQY